MTPLVIAKVGGSLFDMPDLVHRVRSWTVSLGNAAVLLVPGGGAAADVIRALAGVHHLPESTAHWLCLRMMAVNAHFLAKQFDVPVIQSIKRPPDGERGVFGVLDAFAFSRSDEGSDGALEHSWRVTSDTISARVARTCGGSLALLKSTDLPPTCGWEMAAAAGLVDPAFPAVVAACPLPVAWVNLRVARTGEP